MQKQNNDFQIILNCKYLSTLSRSWYKVIQKILLDASQVNVVPVSQKIKPHFRYSEEQ